MTDDPSRLRGGALLLLGAVAVSLGVASGLLGACGPFTDVAADSFCPFVQEVFYLGVTTGTTPTTYEPAATVTRLQMAAFLSRTVDGVLKRGSRRAALNQYWKPLNSTVLDVTTLASGNVLYPVSDGADIWVPGRFGFVSRVRASDGALLGTWTGAPDSVNALSAIGKIFVAAESSPGKLYRVDPRQPPGAVTTLATNLGDVPSGITFDGARVWTANLGNVTGSVSIATPGSSTPWTVTTVTTGFGEPAGALFDGTHVWITDLSGKLFKLDSSAAILQTVTVGATPFLPVFDGANIWVPNYDSNSISVVRASNGAVLATLTGNGLSSPNQAVFDGERLLVTNASGNSVSLWKAADLTPIGNVLTGPSSNPYGACSDGINFWLAFRDNQLARF